MDPREQSKRNHPAYQAKVDRDFNAIVENYNETWAPKVGDRVKHSVSTYRGRVVLRVLDQPLSLNTEAARRLAAELNRNADIIDNPQPRSAN